MARLRTFAVSTSAVSIALCILILSTFCFAAAPDRITRAINAGQIVALTRSHHPTAKTEYDKGLVDPSRELGYITVLTAPSPSQQKALDRLLAEQQNPKSPNYHKWLTPQQYADRFGLSRNDLAKLSGWLQSYGFQVLGTGGGHNSIVFKGTVGQAQKAFNTEIHAYNVDGERHFANATPLTIPNALRGVVSAVIGLNDFRLQPAVKGRHLVGLRNGQPDYYDGNYLFPNFLAPGDIATIYDITPLYTAPTPIDGTGQKLAIVGQTDIYIADINDFRKGFGLSTIPTSGANSCSTKSGLVISPCDTSIFQYVLLGTDPGGPAGDIIEADLDIEWAGAVARNAQIIYINGETPGGVLDSLVAAINPPSGPPLAPVVSMSYGICEAFAPDLESLLQQGNVEGVTVLNSSGDAGSATCDRNPPNGSRPFNPAVFGLAVSYPASSPEVTAVGGTGISLADDSYPAPSSYWSTTIGANGGTAQSYIPELAWNDDVELAQFCQTDSSNQFCASGFGTLGWVPLGVAATAAQVQEDIWISQGGGGASNCWYLDNNGVCLGAGPGPVGGGFAQPSYQQGLSVPLAPAGVRYVPDVSLFGSPNFPGFVFCTPLFEFGINSSTSSCANGVFDAVDTYGSIIGGTSASAPVFAGMVTLLNQYLQGNSSAGLGNINPALYTLAATPANQAFNTVNTGTNVVYCQPGTPVGYPANVQCPGGGSIGFDAANFDSTTHYNLVTGLGSVDVANLALAWGTLAGDFTFTPDFPNQSQTVKAGVTTAAYSFTATPGGGATTFSAPVYFSCSFSPTDPTLSNSSCIFSPAYVPAGQVASSVAMIITTAGPNTLSAPTKKSHRADKRSPWLPLTLPIAGILFAGLAGRRISKYSLLAGLSISLVLLGLLVACGGGSSNSGGNTGPPPISVTVSASPSSVYPNNTADNWPLQTAQFTATVHNSSNQNVTWSVTGGDANGTIDANGLYTAPQIVSGLPSTVTVVATAAADTSKTGSRQETLLPATLPGTYTVNVTATSGGTSLPSVPVTLVVQ